MPLTKCDLGQVCVAVLYCLLSAGIIFGFAAIKPVLIREGVYRNYCTKEELQKGGEVCYGQEIRSVAQRLKSAFC